MYERHPFNGTVHQLLPRSPQERLHDTKLGAPYKGRRACKTRKRHMQVV